MGFPDLEDLPCHHIFVERQPYALSCWVKIGEENLSLITHENYSINGGLPWIPGFCIDMPTWMEDPWSLVSWVSQGLEAILIKAQNLAIVVLCSLNGRELNRMIDCCG